MSQVEMNNLSVAVNGRAKAHQQTQKTEAEGKSSVAPLPAQDTDSTRSVMREASDALPVSRRDEYQFAVDDELDKLVIKIVNSDTKELVRQIPAEEMLDLAKRMVQISKLLYGNSAIA